MTRTERLRDTTVAITGGARGIGAQIAAAFVVAGARVAIGDIDVDLVAKTAAELGPNVIGLPLDVTDTAAFEKFLDETEDRLGPLDVLVNNAGIMPIGSFLDEPDALTDRTVDIDLRGVLTGSKLAARRFAGCDRGHLVNIASVMGTVAAPNAVTYCATKYAVVGLSEALRQELRTTNVRVTTVLPGFVRTELIAGMSPSQLTQRLGMVGPEDVARAVVQAVTSDRGGEVFVPHTAGLISRATTPLPTRLRAALFRAAGTEKVTRGLDAKARAAYQQRAAGTAQ